MADTATAPPPVQPPAPVATDGALPNADAAAEGVAASEAPPAAPAAAKPKQNDRGYGLFKKVVTNPAGEVDAAELLAALQGVSGTDKPLYLLVRVGKTEAHTPKKAIEKIGGEQDLKGNYEVIGDAGRVEFKDVTTEVRRTVTIG